MKKREVKFKLNGLAPSSNHALVVARGGRRYPSKEFKEWKERVSKLPIKKIVDSEWYEVERIYHMPLYYKNGNVRKVDTSNRDKYTDDELCKRLITYSGKEVDDCHIKQGSHMKIDCKQGEEYTEWIIWAIG